MWKVTIKICIKQDYAAEGLVTRWQIIYIFLNYFVNTKYFIHVSISFEASPPRFNRYFLIWRQKSDENFQNTQFYLPQHVSKENVFRIHNAS